jgi:hypothetical protein
VQIPCSQKEKQKKLQRENLKGIFYRDKAKMVYFIGVKDLFTLKIK